MTGTTGAPLESPSAQASSATADGATVAAVLAAGIGAFAVGFFVIINEAGLYAAPGLYGPAGGVSGRTTFAVVVWLIAWVVLHRRWSGRELEPRRAYAVAMLLIAIGVVLCFPPVWALVG